MLEAVVAIALRAVVVSIVLGGVLAAGVFLATRALALTASTRHALWTTALVAMAVMPLAGIGMSVARGVHDTAAAPHTWVVPPAGPLAHPVPHAPARGTPHLTAPIPSTGDRLAAARSLAASAPHVSRTFALGVVGVWLAGAIAGLIGLIASVMRVRGLRKRSSPLDGTLADELPWLTETTGGREIYVRLSYETETPVAIGFRRPVVLIPTELATADGLAAIESLVLHEHAHLRRYDDWTNLVQRIVERLFWFNPIVWLVGRRIALEREIASDDAVVERTGAAHEYATSLWRLAREMRMPEHAVVAPGALLTRKQISVRIEQLLDKNRARLHRSPAAAFGVVLAGVLGVGVVATSAPAVELPPAAEPVAVATTAPTTSPVRVTHESTAHHVVEEKHVVILTTAAPHASGTTRSSSASTAASAPRHVAIILKDTTAETPADPPPTLPPLPRMPTVPPVPAIPVTPPVPPTPGRIRDIHVHLTPDALKHAGTAFGTDIAQIVRDALATSGEAASNAKVIVQATGEAPQHGRNLDGTRPTRELLAHCIGCSAKGADLHGIDLHGVSLTGSNFNGADLHGANLAGARLIGVSLRGANLSGADLRGAQLNGVELANADLSNALLDDVKLSGISLRSVSLRGTALRSLIANCVGCDFARMDLHGQDLHGITLNGADLSFADLHDANLSGVRFTGVDLAHANLAGADVSGASFTGCDLRGTNRDGLHGDLRVTGSDVN